MKVCPACKEITSRNKGCSRSDCPVQNSTALASNPRVDPGITGKADQAVQSGLDKASNVARNGTRKAAFALVAVFILAFAIVPLLFNAGDGSSASEQIEVTVISEANVRNAPTTEGSTVVDTAAAGTQIKGSWVNGSTDPTERWFEIEDNRKFVWEGNIREKSAPQSSNAAQFQSSPNKIPSHFWGKWTDDVSRCQTRYDDSALEIYADAVRFWESEGQVVKVEIFGDQVEAKLSMVGEGEQWDSTLRLRETPEKRQIMLNGIAKFKCD